MKSAAGRCGSWTAGQVRSGSARPLRVSPGQAAGGEPLTRSHSWVTHPLRFGSSEDARFDFAGCLAPRSDTWGLRTNTVSARLRQKCCTLTYFPVPDQTDTPLSLSIQTTYK